MGLVLSVLLTQYYSVPLILKQFTNLAHFVCANGAWSTSSEVDGFDLGLWRVGELVSWRIGKVVDLTMQCFEIGFYDIASRWLHGCFKVVSTVR